MNLERFFSPVYASLKNHPDDWEMVDQYTIRHKPSGHIYWISNGPMLFQGYNGQGAFIGFIERLFCWPYVKRALCASIGSKYDKKDNEVE